MFQRLFFLILLLPALCGAFDLCAVRLAIAATDFQKLSTFKDSLRQGIGRRTFLPRSLNPSSIQITGKLGGELGKINQGVYRAIMDGKPKIIKLLPQNKDYSEKEFLEGYQLHQILGDLDLAPKLVGQLTHEELKELAVNNPDLKISKSMKAVVMDEIEGAWNPKNSLLGQSPPPSWVKELNPQVIARQLQHMANVISSLEIHPFDAQVFITRDGKVILGDLDFYELVDLKAYMLEGQTHAELNTQRTHSRFKDLETTIKSYIQGPQP